MDKLVTLRLVERLKNSYFVLESKNAKLNEKENLKQQDRPDAVRCEHDTCYAESFL